MESVFAQPLSSVKTEELTQRKSDLSDQKRESQSILKYIQEIVEAGEREETVKMIQGRYDELLTSQATYITLVHAEFNSREIEKQKSFKKSLLNIKISKFKGYESESDVYTFQDEFEKLHLRDTPTDLLPDLLKNNYLSNPARLLVSDVHEIKMLPGKNKLLLVRLNHGS